MVLVDTSTRLHAKALLFRRATGDSTAYIGSLNLSKSALLDGEIWIDSFNAAKLMDPAVRSLMNKITAAANPEYSYHGQVRISVRTNAGAERVWELGNGNTSLSLGSPVRKDEIAAKFDRVFRFMQVSDAQRERAFAQWSDLRAVEDIAEPLRNLARFGRPAAL